MARAQIHTITLSLSLPPLFLSRKHSLSLFRLEQYEVFSWNWSFKNGVTWTRKRFPESFDLLIEVLQTTRYSENYRLNIYLIFVTKIDLCECKLKREKRMSDTNLTTKSVIILKEIFFST